ncbi:MAG TPA: hypothetical protein PK263_00280 [bacterium]|nr:hypothetical protein [bacterium]
MLNGGGGDAPLLLFLVFCLAGLVFISIAFVFAIREFKRTISFKVWVLVNIVPFLLCLNPYLKSFDIDLLPEISIFASLPLQVIPLVGGSGLAIILSLIYLVLAATKPRQNSRPSIFITLGIAISLLAISVLQHLPSFVSNLQDLDRVSYYYVSLIAVPLVLVLAGAYDVATKLRSKLLSLIIICLLMISVLAGGGLLVDSKRARDLIEEAKVTNNLDYSTPIEKIIFIRDGNTWITDSNGKVPVKIESRSDSRIDFLGQEGLSPDQNYFAYADQISNQTLIGDEFDTRNFKVAFDLHTIELSTMEDRVIASPVLPASSFTVDVGWSQDGKILVNTSGKVFAYGLDGKVIDSSSLKPETSKRRKTISPDGSYKVEGKAKNNLTKYYIFGEKGKKYIKLPDNFGYGRWLNDSKRVVLMSFSGLYIADVDGNLKQITNGNYDRISIEQ